MIDHLEQLARAIQRVGRDDDGLRRLLELAAVATMQAATLNALSAEPAPPASEPERVGA